MAIEGNLNNQATFERLPTLTPAAGGGKATYRVRVDKLEHGRTAIQKTEFVRATVSVLDSQGEGALAAGSRAEIFIEDRGFDYAAKETASLLRAMDPSATDINGDLLALSGKDISGENVEIVVEVSQARDRKTGEPKVFPKSGDPIPQRFYSATMPSAVAPKVKAGKQATA